MSEGMTIQLLLLTDITVGDRKRAYREDQIAELAASIEQIGLLNPISVVPSPDDDGYQLVTGLHRLNACRSLGWDEITASVLALDDLDRELAEIDENLRRRELTALEFGEHLLRRDEILRAKGERKPGHRPKKGATVAPLTATADLADDAGVSERSAQRYMRIARELPDAVRDLLRPTAIAAQTSTLENLAKIKKNEDRLEVAKLLASGESTSVYAAERELRSRHAPCPTCGVVLDRFEYCYAVPMHCDQCGNHFAMSEDEWLDVCGKCGWKAHPDAQPPDPAAIQAAAPATVPSATTDVDGQQRLSGAFYSKDEFRRPNGTGNIDPDDFVRALGGATAVVALPGSARVELLRTTTGNVIGVSVQHLADVADETLRADVRESIARLRDWIGRVEAAAPWLGEEVAS